MCAITAWDYSLGSLPRITGGTLEDRLDLELVRIRTGHPGSAEVEKTLLDSAELGSGEGTTEGRKAVPLHTQYSEGIRC